MANRWLSLTVSLQGTVYTCGSQKDSIKAFKPKTFHAQAQVYHHSNLQTP